MTWSGFSGRRAIIFDLDDTILDLGGSAEDWRAVCTEAAGIAEVSASALFDTLAIVQHEFWSDPERHRVGRLDLEKATCSIVSQALSRLGLVDPRLVSQLSLSYRQRRELAMVLFPGAIATLESLAGEGFALGLLTNGAAQPQREKVERFGLGPYFSYIGIEGEVGLGKPLAKAYELALDSLRVAPFEAVMVGDNFEWEVLAPKRLGMGAIWVNRHGKAAPTGPGRQRSHQPDHVVRHVAELV